MSGGLKAVKGGMGKDGVRGICGRAGPLLRRRRKTQRSGLVRPDRGKPRAMRPQPASFAPMSILGPTSCPANESRPLQTVSPGAATRNPPHRLKTGPESSKGSLGLGFHYPSSRLALPGTKVLVRAKGAGKFWEETRNCPKRPGSVGPDKIPRRDLLRQGRSLAQTVADRSGFGLWPALRCRGAEFFSALPEISRSPERLLTQRRHPLIAPKTAFFE